MITMNRLIKYLLPILILTAQLLAGTVTIAWDANPPEENVSGYRVHYGTVSRTYTEVVDVANVTTIALQLDPGVYFLNVLAYNAAGDSDFPEELVVTMPGAPPTPPKGLRVVEIQTSSNLRDWSPVAWVPAGDPPVFLRAVTKEIPKP